MTSQQHDSPSTTSQSGGVAFHGATIGRIDNLVAGDQHALPGLLAGLRALLGRPNVLAGIVGAVCLLNCALVLVRILIGLPLPPLSVVPTILRLMSATTLCGAIFAVVYPHLVALFISRPIEWWLWSALGWIGYALSHFFQVMLWGTVYHALLWMPTSAQGLVGISISMIGINLAVTTWLLVRVRGHVLDDPQHHTQLPSIREALTLAMIACLLFLATPTILLASSWQHLLAHPLNQASLWILGSGGLAWLLRTPPKPMAPGTPVSQQAPGGEHASTL